jgi:tetratricopeptide (TPR) repeat protein
MFQSPHAKILKEIEVKFPPQSRFVICLTFALFGVGSRAPAQSDQRQAAISLEQQGKTAEAASAWEALSRAEPSNPEPFAHLGLLEARQQHYAPAIRFYRKALALDPAMPGLQLNLGLALFKNGDYRQALQSFAPIIKSQPEDQRLNILVGMSHYGLGEYAVAAPYLKRAADRDPNNLTLLLTLAHSCLLSSQYPCVLDAYHRLIAQNAESAEADMLVGEALDEMKDPVGAMREFREAIVANPKEPNVHFGLGYLLWTKGQYPEAAKEFQAELANDPQHLQAMLYLADAQMQMSQMDEAMPLLEKLVKLSPQNAMAHLDLGIVYADQGRKPEALAELKQSIRLAPNNVNAHWRLGRLYRSMGMTTEAKAEFDNASSLNKTEDERLLKVMSTIPASDRKSSARTDTSTPK